MLVPVWWILLWTEELNRRYNNFTFVDYFFVGLLPASGILMLLIWCFVDLNGYTGYTVSPTIIDGYGSTPITVEITERTSTHVIIFSDTNIYAGPQCWIKPSHVPTAYGSWDDDIRVLQGVWEDPCSYGDSQDCETRFSCEVPHQLIETDAFFQRSNHFMVYASMDGRHPLLVDGSTSWDQYPTFELVTGSLLVSPTSYWCLLHCLCLTVDHGVFV